MGEVVQAPPRQLQPEEVEKFSFFLRDQSVYLRAAVAYYTNGAYKDGLLLRRRATLQWAVAAAFFIAGSPAMAWRKVSKVQSAIWDVRDRYLLDSVGIDSFVHTIQEEDLAKLTVKELTT